MIILALPELFRAVNPEVDGEAAQAEVAVTDESGVATTDQHAFGNANGNVTDCPEFDATEVVFPHCTIKPLGNFW